MFYKFMFYLNWLSSHMCPFIGWECCIMCPTPMVLRLSRRTPVGKAGSEYSDMHKCLWDHTLSIQNLFNAFSP